MKSKWAFIRVCLLASIVLMACAPQTVIIKTTVEVEKQVEVTVKVAKEVTQVVDETVQVVEVVPIVFEDGPPSNPHLPPDNKPPLAFSQSVDGVNEQIIAFTFPEGSEDWTIPIKAAPLADIQSSPYSLPDGWEELTPVGVVEIGDLGKIEPGIYLVALGLGATGDEVPGRLFPITASSEIEVPFQGIPQVLNPERSGSVHQQFQELASPSDNNVTISAGSVCFVVKTGGDSDYIRYCSAPGSALSVIDNFASQFEALMASIQGVAEGFDLQNDIQYDQIISEKENVSSLNACRDLANRPDAARQGLQQACSSDITVGPVSEKYFWDNYHDPKSPLSDGRFSVPVAVVQVLGQIATDADPIRRGVYRMDYWFYASGQFYAATISGFTTNPAGNRTGEVINQPVPTVPAAFVNAEENAPPQPGAQISTCRVFGRCSFFQNSCS